MASTSSTRPGSRNQQRAGARQHTDGLDVNGMRASPINCVTSSGSVVALGAANDGKGVVARGGDERTWWAVEGGGLIKEWRSKSAEPAAGVEMAQAGGKILTGWDRAGKKFWVGQKALEG